MSVVQQQQQQRMMYPNDNTTKQYTGSCNNNSSSSSTTPCIDSNNSSTSTASSNLIFVLEDDNIMNITHTLHMIQQQQQLKSIPIRRITMNVSKIGTSRLRRNGKTTYHDGRIWLPNGFNHLLQYIQSNPYLQEICITGKSLSVGGENTDDTTTTTTTMGSSCSNNSALTIDSFSSLSSSSPLQTLVVMYLIEAIEGNHIAIQTLTLHAVHIEIESFARYIRRTKTLYHLSIINCTFYNHHHSHHHHHKIDHSKSSCYNGTIHHTSNSSSSSKTNTVQQQQQSIGASFALNKSIQSLRWNGIYNDTFVLSILEQLKCHSTLCKLDISCTSSNILIMVGQVLSYTTTCQRSTVVSPQQQQQPLLLASKIQHLIIRHSSLHGLESFVRCITSSSVSMIPLQSLDIIHCSIDTVSASILRTLFRSVSNKKLNTLHHVRFCNVQLCRENENDHHVSIGGCGILEEILSGVINNNNTTSAIHSITLHKIFGLDNCDYDALLLYFDRTNHIQQYEQHNQQQQHGRLITKMKCDDIIRMKLEMICRQRNIDVQSSCSVNYTIKINTSDTKNTTTRTLTSI